MRIYPLVQRRTPESADSPAQTTDEATSLAQYRIRSADGSEVVVPSSAALTSRILEGVIQPDTVIFDAGRGLWCRAAEAPLVRFIVEVSIDRPELKGWTTETGTPEAVPVESASTETDFLAALQVAFPSTVEKAPEPKAAVAQRTDADAVAAILDRIAPLSQVQTPPNAPRVVVTAPAKPIDPPAKAISAKPIDPPAKAIPAKPIDPPAKAISVKPIDPPAKAVAASAKPTNPPAKPINPPAKPIAPKPKPIVPDWVSELDLTPDPIPDWELGPEVETADTSLERVTAGAGVGVPLATLRRTRVVVTSLVGSVSAMVALGVVLQGGEANADDLSDPSISMMPSEAPVTLDEIPQPEISSEPPAAVEAEPVRAPKVVPDATWPVMEPLRPPKMIEIPAMPSLGEEQIAGTVDNRPSDNSGLVALPSLPRPSRDADRPTQLPQVKNASRVQQALDREYPIGLREIGTGGRVELSFYINEQGMVERYEIKESSGVAALDQAALRVAPVFEFTPAMRGRERMAVWYSSGVTFGRVTSATAGVASADARTPSSQGAADLPDQPTATQFDVAPQVRNAAQVRQALEREYPIGLRATGVGGPVEVWFYVDAQGSVEQSRLKKSSGNAALDKAALEVAQVFQFNPGQRGNERVAGWFSFRIVFDPMSEGKR